MFYTVNEVMLVDPYGCMHQDIRAYLKRKQNVHTTKIPALIEPSVIM